MPGSLSVLALVSLARSIGLCAYILLPKTGLVFSLNAAGVYEQLFGCIEDEEEVRRRLQLVFWTWALADTIS